MMDQSFDRKVSKRGSQTLDLQRGFSTSGSLRNGLFNMSRSLSDGICHFQSLNNKSLSLSEDRAQTRVQNLTAKQPPRPPEYLNKAEAPQGMQRKGPCISIVNSLPRIKSPCLMLIS